MPDPFLFVFEPETSPATPGIAAFTPNQATGKALEPSQLSQASTSGFSPFPSWNPTNKLPTPAFMKQLFKTPSSIVRTPGRREVTPDHNHVSLLVVSYMTR